MAGDWGAAKLDAAYDFDILAVAPQAAPILVVAGGHILWHPGFGDNHVHRIVIFPCPG